jgi:hypothetical protein
VYPHTDIPRLFTAHQMNALKRGQKLRLKQITPLQKMQKMTVDYLWMGQNELLACVKDLSDVYVIVCGGINGILVELVVNSSNAFGFPE